MSDTTPDESRVPDDSRVPEADVTEVSAAEAATPAAGAAAASETEAAGATATDADTASAADTGASASAKPKKAKAAKTKAAKTKATKQRGATAAPRRRTSPRRVVAHIVGSIAALALIGATGWALFNVESPSYAVEPAGLDLTPTPGEQVRVCPGPLLQLGTQADGDASVASPVGTSTVSVAAVGTETQTTPLGENGPTAVTGAGTVDGATTSVAAVDTSTHGTSITSGLTATSCDQPAATKWLVGGATTLGESLVLDVVNPGTSAVRVSFNVFTENGRVTPAFPEAIIEAGASYQAPLSSVAPNAKSIAVQLTASGGSVSAFLHETRTQTLDAVGADIIGASPLPATSQVLPALNVINRPGHEVDMADASTETAVRMLNPAQEEVHGVVRLRDLDGNIASSEDITLQPGRVVDLPLGELPTGDFTVELVADGPVLLAGENHPGEEHDFAWQAASPQLLDHVTLPVADAPGAQLGIMNPADAVREVEVLAQGQTQTVTLQPGATRILDVAAGTVELTGATDLVAVVRYRAASQLAVVPVVPGNADAESITVVK